MLAQEKSMERPPTSRVERLREGVINAPQEVSVERARYLTQSMTKNWDKHPLTRMSMALENILDNISVTIRDDELIVGGRTEKLKGAPLFPENKSKWIEGDLDTFEKRTVQRALITEEEKRELKEDILPFWDGKTVENLLYKTLPPDVEEDMDKYIFTMMLEITYGIGHFTMNHPKVLSLGLKGIIEDAKKRYNALAPEECSGEKGLFYDAVVRSLKAAIRFAHRYAALAASMAEKEKDPVRAEELKTIAQVCSRVPEHPAQTFYEAIQSVYFIHLIAQIESGGNSISLGRIDQILYPFYRADKESGRITPDKAKELISLLFIKTNEIWNVLEEVFSPGGEGTEGKTTQNVTVGGLGTDGADATNELSYIGLDAYADIRTVQPNFGVRLSSKTPEDFYLRVVTYAKDDVLMHLFNDDIIIQSLTKAGHTLEDARDYGVVGCLEPNAQGKTFGSTFAVQFNGIKCVEFALSNGVDNTFGYLSGIESGEPASFTSFEDVWNAYDAQMSHFTGQVAKGMNVMDQSIADLVPSPFASAMIEGPLEKALDLTKGGAVYNSTGVQFIGFANVIDSLFGIKKAVYEDKRVSLKDLSAWLAEDWLDADDKRSFFLNKIPKYGNDNDEVDAMGIKVLNHFCDELEKHKNFRGGAFRPGVFSVGFHLAFGSFTAATPDGRYSGDVLGNGLSPTTGNEIYGPTAVMNSLTKLPLTRIHNGANLNMRFSGKQIKAGNLMALIKAYFAKGGIQVQFNMVDPDILRDAKVHPERYKDLVVRISGYSVLFTGLSETAQDEIISRTEFEL
ncbi:MAG: formate C-acetyltransferase/glycerol dehydratase family glycyl radical enzyme [Thermodesulfobacteriota bacterium]|nr:formate C-acetyltransferase/glycerol dehydratase family glycyl radical enzyme [Thermodesulfobacteriota bacterium]